MMQDFTKYWRRVRARTLRIIDVIPEELVDWSPATDAMTFGDVVRHLAVTERWLFVEVACGRPTRYETHAAELAPTLAAARTLMASLHAESLVILEAIGAEDLTKMITTPGGHSTAMWKWLQAMAEHEVHHRGQLYLMLRLQGVPTPPIFGMTSEDVRARAIRRSVGVAACGTHPNDGEPNTVATISGPSRVCPASHSDMRKSDWTHTQLSQILRSGGAAHDHESDNLTPHRHIVRRDGCNTITTWGT